MFVEVIGVIAIILGVAAGIFGIICLTVVAVESDRTTKKLDILMDYLGVNVELKPEPKLIELPEDKEE